MNTGRADPLVPAMDCMHPILARRSNFLLYLGSWIPAVALLAFLLWYSDGSGWREALFLAVPMGVVLAFLSLSAWYLCRAFPLARSSYLNIAAVFMAASLLSSATWVAIGWAMLAVLSKAPAVAAIAEHYDRQLPLLFVAGTLLFLNSSAVHYLIAAVEESKAAEERSLKLQVLARQAELKALRVQINPHFLFNSLNSISALTSIDAGRARNMCQLLADFLRKSLELGGENFITLDQEITLAKDFLAIEKVRFGSRLAVDVDVAEESRGCLVPSLLLQPLVENAVMHGISQSVDGGTVRIEASVLGDQLRISVTNPCEGTAAMPRRQGFGLENTRQRLYVNYGLRAKVDVQKSAKWFRVETSFPAGRIAK